MPPAAASRPRSVLVDAPGPLATEARLLERIAELAAEHRREPGLLRRPVRIVVPSGSLRAHLCERLVAPAGATLGVEVQTLFQLAAEILQRAGEPLRAADAWADLLIRRRAREERALSEAFDGFRDGYRAVGATVRDLLDAGFEVAHAEACREALEELRLPLDQRKRIEACLRVAGHTAASLAEAGLASRTDVLRRAGELFAADPERVLPTRALVVHGFADATGRAAELLESLVRRLPAAVLIDRPRDPRDSGREDLGVEFCERLAARLGGACGERVTVEAAGVESAPELFRAPGAEAEAREIARRIRDLLAAGVVPERIGIVARDLRPHAVALRAQLARLGVPYSGLAARSPVDGPGRRLLAALELLERGADCPAERWLDAVERVSSSDGANGSAPSALLRLAVRVLGASRLGELAAVDPRRHADLRLPAVEGARPRAPEDERGGRAVAPVRLDVAELDAAVAAAEAARRRLESWPASAPLATHLARFAELCTADLGWTDGEPARRVAGALETLATPPQLEHAFEEFTFVLRRVLAEETTLPIGGAGGGVQVLGATEARGRTFEHLFVAGLNRDAFPRVGSADPLLSDDVRGALAALLPEIPVKARGRSEERYMFAQLVAAAPRVTLSWQYAGDDGKARIVSPLLERLLGDRRETDIETAAAVLPLDDGAAPSDAPRTPRESAVLAGLRGGLHRDPDEHARRLELALAEELACGMAALPATATSDGCREVAAARARVVAAFEAGAFEPQRLAPWLGFLGERAADDARPDSTRGELFVTRFEAVATCPWRAVLERVLRLARAPDPLESLPAIESLALGSVVHGALQRIAETALGASGNSGGELDEVLRREPVPVSWPGAERLDALLLEFARRETAGRATGYPGLPRALAEYARPYVDRAGELLGWSSGNAVVLGAEVRGTAGVELPGGVHLDVPFAADLVERRGEDAVLTDYKTGKAKSAGALASTHLPRGEALQSTAYAVAAAAAGDDSAVGRYLYLGPDVDAAKAAVDAGPWRERLEAFTAALGAVTAAWSAGTCFPRLLDPLKDAEPQACAHCDVALACLVRDSGARRALATYTAPDGAAPGAMKDLWALAQRKDEGAGKRSGRRKGSA